MSMRWNAGAVLAVALVFGATPSAKAGPDDAEPPTGSSPFVEPPPSGPVVVVPEEAPPQPPPAEWGPPQAPPAQWGPPPPPPDGGWAPPPPIAPFSQPRLRAGFSIIGGPSVPGGRGDAGAFGGASARLGLQIDRRWGVYYMGTAIIGGYGYVGVDYTESFVFAAAYNTIAASITVADRLDFGFGPSFDAIAAISVSTSSGGAAVGVLEGSGFGLHAHAGIVLGAMPPGPARSGFTFTLDLHPTFIDGTVLFTTAIGLGGEWY